MSEATAIAQTNLQVRGTGANAAEAQDDAQSLTLGARGQGSVATTLQPQDTGDLLLVASARTPAGGDAVAGRIEVASPLIATRKLQAGWIGEDALQLDLPSMPEHAHDPSLRVSLLRGGAGLTSQWTRTCATTRIAAGSRSSAVPSARHWRWSAEIPAGPMQPMR